MSFYTGSYCVITVVNICYGSWWSALNVANRKHKSQQQYFSVWCVLQEKAPVWEKLLDSKNPHKLMYSLQIVESLSRPPKHRRRPVVRLHTANSWFDRSKTVLLTLFLPFHSCGQGQIPSWAQIRIFQTGMRKRLPKRSGAESSSAEEV